MSNRSKGELIDLSRVVLSSEAVTAWKQVSFGVAQICLVSGLSEAQIPEEEACLVEGGSLLLFVSLPGGKEIGIEVPADHWRFLE